VSSLRGWVWERTLHDSVVNTLGAIATGGVVTSEALIRRRCEADLVVIEHVREQLDPPTPDDLHDVLRTAAQLGLRVDRRAASTFDALLDASSAAQRRVALAVVVEALLNVAKHARTDQIEISCSASTRDFWVVDRGVGLSGTDRRRLRESLDRRALDADLVVSLDHPARGTTVRIHVPERSALPTTGEGRTLWGATVVACLLLWSRVADLLERRRRNGLAEVLRESDAILSAVAADPSLVRDPLTRARAALEESYLRALIGFSSASLSAGRLTAVINHARVRHVRLELGRAATGFDGDDAVTVLRVVDDVVGGCPPGARVGVSRFCEGAGRLVVVVAPEAALDGLAGLPAAAAVLTFVSAEDSWAEIRWTSPSPSCATSSVRAGRGPA
jgi:anti-sigma regulatory factor (Ser/Thr protein kinase)